MTPCHLRRAYENDRRYSFGVISGDGGLGQAAFRRGIGRLRHLAGGLAADYALLAVVGRGLGGRLTTAAACAATAVGDQRATGATPVVVRGAPQVLHVLHPHPRRRARRSAKASVGLRRAAPSAINMAPTTTIFTRLMTCSFRKYGGNHTTTTCAPSARRPVRAPGRPLDIQRRVRQCLRRGRVAAAAGSAPRETHLPCRSDAVRWGTGIAPMGTCRPSP